MHACLKSNKLKLPRVIESIQAAITLDRHLLTDAEISDIEQSIKFVADISQGEDADAIEAAIEKLDQATAVFAERRMDSSINKALSGQSVEKL